MRQIMKSGELEVKNSHLDKMATLIAKSLWCAKGACEGVTPALTAFGVFAAYGEPWKAKGQDPVMLPLLASLLLP